MITLQFIMWYALILIVIALIISGIDDLIFDIIYWVHFAYHSILKLFYKKLTYNDLISTEEKNIALIIPCWVESVLIGSKSSFNLPIIDYSKYIDYKNFEVFIGVYPNDPKSIEILKNIKKVYKNVHLVISDEAEPENKVKNLIAIQKYVNKFEREFDTKFDIFVIHNPEDVIHPLSFRLYNHLIPRKDMIQIPVFPLELPYSNWDHWTFCDAFAEMYTKDMVVREILKNIIPLSAMVTAYSRDAMHEFVTELENTDDLLDVNLKEKKAIFLFQAITRLVKKKPWWLFGKTIYAKVKEHVATRALMPTRYLASIMQRNRKFYSSALKYEKKVNWKSKLLIKYMLFHNRIPSINTFIIGLTYIIGIYWLIIYLFSLYNPNVTNLGYFLKDSPVVTILIYILLIMIANRFLQRFLAAIRVYGFIAGLLSIPRLIFSNILKLRSIVYPSLIWIAKKILEPRHLIEIKNLSPIEQQLFKYKLKLGDILLQKKLIHTKDLKAALLKQLEKDKQVEQHEKIGAILTKQKKLTDVQLGDALEQKRSLSIINLTLSDVIPFELMLAIDKDTYLWLINNQLFPVHIEKNIITLATIDPKHENLLSQAKQKLSPLKVKFAEAKLSNIIAKTRG